MNVLSLHFIKFFLPFFKFCMIFTQIDHPQQQQKGAYRSVVSSQRKRAVIACFQQKSLHSLPRFQSFFLFFFLTKFIFGCL